MVKQHQIAPAHVIANEVAGLVIPNPVPVLLASGALLQVVDAEGIGLAFYQPIIHCITMAFLCQGGGTGGFRTGS
jgi:hypothetical protein